MVFNLLRLYAIQINYSSYCYLHKEKGDFHDVNETLRIKLLLNNIEYK